MPKNLEITISDSGQIISPLQVNNSIPSPTEQSVHNKALGGSAALVTTAGIQIVKQATTRILGNVGDFTGNRQQQNRINNGLKVVNFGAFVVQGAAAGSAFGIVGAGVGAAVAAGIQAFDVVATNIEYNNQIELDNTERAYQRNITIFSNNNNRAGGNS